MQNIQKLNKIKYAKLVSDPTKSLTEISGRYKVNFGTEKFIFNDIKKKLAVKKNISLLDIGCGCGLLSNFLIKFYLKNRLSIYLCDISEVILNLKKKFKKNINFIPSEFLKYNFKNNKFDRILIYSVIHYSNNPKNFLKKAFDLLNNKGIILVGDIPNIDKKYRFLRSEFGRKFSEKHNYNNTNLEKLTKNYKSFLRNTKQNLLLNDKFIKWVKLFFKEKGGKVLIRKQPVKLPYSYTRVDILIKK